MVTSPAPSAPAASVPAAQARATTGPAASATAPSVPEPAASMMQRHRFTVDDFARMGEAGIFHEDDRVELIDGEICDMTPIGPLHAWLVNRLNRRIVTLLSDRAYVSVQNPIRLGLHTEPQPDLVIARGGEDDYADHHPAADDVLLVIEVADSSLRYDRLAKMPLYARFGIPEAWLVDATGHTVTVRTGPGRDGYGRDRTWGRGDTLVATAIADLRLAVAEIFGR